MAHSLQRFEVVSRFRCLGAECPDTCCRGWEMPADARQQALYHQRAPELLEAIDAANGVMKRCGNAEQCHELRDGICRIHQAHGEEFLGDACYFYPRLMHQLGGQHIMSGAPSCPEMLRLILSDPAPFTLREGTVPRLPVHRRDLLPDGMDEAAMLAHLKRALAIAGDDTATPEDALSSLLDVALALAGEEDSAPAQPLPGDAHALYYALALTEAFGRPGISAGLAAVMAHIEQTLDCRFDRATRQLTLGPVASRAYIALRTRWQVDAARALTRTLRRWLQAQVAMTFFPFGGFPDATIKERAAVLVQRFATVRLVLMCHVSAASVPPDESTVIRVISSLARFHDHLADIALTRMIHRDSGWESIARLRGLIAG